MTPAEQRFSIICERKNFSSIEDLASNLGIPAPTLRKAGQRNSISKPIATAISEKLGFPFEWVLNGSDPIESAAVRQDPKKNDLSTDIPEVDIRAGMGGGGVYATEYNHTDEFGNTTSVDNVKAVWSFPSAYVRDELRSPANKVWLLEVKGDSMEPTLRSGDRVMVDTSDITPAPGGVFALYDGLSVVVKRLDHIMNSEPPKVRVISDNPRHGEKTYLLDEVKVIGRVVWFGRRL